MRTSPASTFNNTSSDFIKAEERPKEPPLAEKVKRSRECRLKVEDLLEQKEFEKQFKLL